MINPYNISICIYFVVFVLYNNYVGHVYCIMIYHVILLFISRYLPTNSTQTLILQEHLV